MKRTLVGVAISTAIAAPGAFAESVMYGKIHSSIDYHDDFGGANQTYKVESRSSRLGFKGSEDLGNGLKAIYQLELSFNSDGGGTGQSGANSGLGAASRNTFVGLSGGWGTFLVGRHDTPAKMAFYASGNELLGDSAIDLHTGDLAVFNELRANNTIAYVSPNFSGFSFAAAVIPGEETGGGNASDGIADHVSLGLMYQGGGLKVGVGYEELDNQAVGTSSAAPNVDREMWQAGASYSFGMFQIGAHYETTDNPVVGATFQDGADYKAWAITGKAMFGNSAVSLIYTDSDTEDNAGATVSETQGWGIAGEHNLSKRTKLYAAYATQDEDVTPSSTAHRVSLGVIHDF